VRLVEVRVGYHTGTCYVGALAYADDIVLLALTPAAMRQELEICEEFANEHGIAFDGNKSKCLISEPRKCSVHLGHVIRSDVDDSGDVES